MSPLVPGSSSPWILWAPGLLGTLVHCGLCIPRVPWAFCTPSPLDPWAFWTPWFLLLTPFQILNSNQSQCLKLKLGLLIMKLLKFNLHHVPQIPWVPKKPATKLTLNESAILEFQANCEKNWIAITFKFSQNSQKWEYWHQRLYYVKTKNPATKCCPSEH